MNERELWNAYSTMLLRTVKRFTRIPMQTVLPSVIISTLYLLVFGTFLGSQVGSIHGFTYIQYILPGLIMMAVIINAVQETISQVFFGKFQKNIEEILVSPMPSSIIVAGFVSAGVVRGFINGTLVLLVGLLFTHIQVHSYGILFLSFLSTALLFSLLGVLNGMIVKGFDGIAILPTFILTPLTYLGGVFYSVAMLPPFWRFLSYGNPILYMINTFRYGFLGISDVSLITSFAIIFGFIFVLGATVVYLFKAGYGIKS